MLIFQSKGWNCFFNPINRIPVKHLHFVITIMLFCFIQQNASAQFFAGPADQDYCLTSGAAVNFNATFVLEAGTPPASFTFSSTDITINLVSPAAGVTNTLPGNIGTSGASYTLSITNSTTFYTVNLSIVSGITLGLNGMQYTCTAVDGIPTVSPVGELTVASPITITVVSPMSLAIIACEGADVTLDVSTTAIPDSYAWKKVGGGTVGTAEDLTLSSVDLADQGSYELTISDAGCPDVTSSSISVVVVPNVAIVDTDMVPKELNPGDTKTYTATASNVDNTSTFTWDIDGNSVTAGMLPTTIMIGTNTIQINSISNAPVDATTTASTLSLSNITMAPASTNYTAPVQMTATNNATCVATTATVMSGATTVFPVEWTYFNASEMDENTVQLKWGTASETNNDKFIIERSTDGKVFSDIDEVFGAGTTTQSKDYYFIDNKLPRSQMLYYRIKQVDYDGAMNYSKVLFVQMKNQGDVSIGPISFNQKIGRLPIQSTKNGEAEIKIFDARGLLVLGKKISVIQGTQLATFQLTTSTRGIYFLQMVFNDTVISTSFIN